MGQGRWPPPGEDGEGSARRDAERRRGPCVVVPDWLVHARYGEERVASDPCHRAQRKRPEPTTRRAGRPVVAGERPTPLVRVVAVADLANGISSMVDLDRWTYVNADLTVWCHRQATGEWVGLESHTAVVDTGVGCSHSAVFDTHQPLGWSAQSLLIDTRPTAPRTPRRAAPRSASPAAEPASSHPTASP
ncbi:MAG: hypothetical protein ACRD2C_11560 [Acidimicrobiales bacterium]